MIILSTLKGFLQLIPTGLITGRDENTQFWVDLHQTANTLPREDVLWHCTPVTPLDLPLAGANEALTGIFRNLTECKGREHSLIPGAAGKGL